MPLLEGYIAAWKKYPKDEVKIRVAQPSVLSPSKNLLRLYKIGAMSWKDYEELFRREITNSPKAMRKLCEIKELAKTKNIRLICYEKNPPCHRFILIDMINNLKE